jgi:P pilus assembly chaperone PapD
MKKIALSALLILFASRCFASGMVPETSVLLVDEGKGEASMNVTNTDDKPTLLYTRIAELPDSNATTRLVATQPVVRVEAGQIQRVRFMLHTAAPLQQQELKRVTFEGIPPKEKGKSQLAITVRQDLPVIIHPAGLAQDLEPWRHIQWQKKGGDLEVVNPSKYVVRLANAFTTKPSGKEGLLPATYLLPGARITVKLPATTDTSVTFLPASRYGYQGASYTAVLQ